MLLCRVVPVLKTLNHNNRQIRTELSIISNSTNELSKYTSYNDQRKKAVILTPSTLMPNSLFLLECQLARNSKVTVSNGNA